MSVTNVRPTFSTEGVSLGDVSTVGRRSNPHSPMSVGSIGASTNSIRAKAVRKRQINATHNSNFRAGYVPVEEDALHRAGIRGRKRYFLYCTLAVLMVVAVLNAATTAWLLYILGITHNGLTSLELTTVDGRDFFRVLSNAEIHTMSMTDVPLGASYERNLSFEAENSKVELIIKSISKQTPSIILENSEIVVVTDNFLVKASNKTDWFSTNLASLIGQDLILNLSADQLSTSKISSKEDYEDLSIESLRDLNILAEDNLAITSSKTIKFTTPSMNMYSQSATIITSDGLYLGNKLPKVNTSNSKNYQGATGYKLCLCENGRVYKVHVGRPGTSCLDVDLNELDNFCSVNKI